MIVKFAKSTDVNDRHYARGDSRDFDIATAKALITSGSAIDPEKVEVVEQKPVKHTGKK